MLRRVLHYKTKVTPLAAATAAMSTEATATQVSATDSKTSDQMAILQVMRFDPSTNTKRVDTFQYVKNQDFMVLDLLTAIKAHQDNTLAFRASCCEGVCGSCSMSIDGVNSLACITPADKCKTIVGPLPNFPILKDLVVDLRGFFKQYEFIRPYIRNIYLPQQRINFIYDKYLSTAAALYGERVTAASTNIGNGKKSTEAAATTAVLGHPGAYMVYAKMLDRVVGTGDAAKAASIMLKMRHEGYVVEDSAARSILKDALKNKKA